MGSPGGEGPLSFLANLRRANLDISPPMHQECRAAVDDRGRGLQPHRGQLGRETHGRGAVQVKESKKILSIKIL